MADTTVHVDTGLQAWQGGVLGAAVGGMAGYGIVLMIHGFRQMSACDDLLDQTCEEVETPTGFYIGAMFLGAVLGYVRGSYLARN